MLRRMLVVFGATVAQMVIIGAVVWLVYQSHAWWSYLLWYIVVLLLSICWVLYPLQSMWRKMLWPVSAAMLVGGISVIDSLIVVLLLTAAAFVSNVLSGVVALSLARFLVFSR